MGEVKPPTQVHPVGQRQSWDLNPSLLGSSIIALIGDVPLSSDAASVPDMVRRRAVNMSTVAVQGSQQFLAPEIAEGVGQLGSCPEGQVIKESRRDLLEGNSVALLTILLLVKGAVSD